MDFFLLEALKHRSFVFLWMNCLRGSRCGHGGFSRGTDNTIQRHKTTTVYEALLSEISGTNIKIINMGMQISTGIEIHFLNVSISTHLGTPK